MLETKLNPDSMLSHIERKIKLHTIAFLVYSFSSNLYTYTRSTPGWPSSHF